MIRLNRAEGVIVTTDETNNRCYFPDSLRLQGLKANYLFFYCDDLDVPQPNPGTGEIDGNKDASRRRFRPWRKNQIRLANVKEIGSDYLVLVSGSLEIASKIPLIQLYRMTKNGTPYFINDKVDFSKCYIERANNKKVADYLFVFGLEEKGHQPTNLNYKKALFRYEHSEVVLDLNGKDGGGNEFSSDIPVNRYFFEDQESFRGRSLKSLKVDMEMSNEITPQGRRFASAQDIYMSMLCLRGIDGNDLIYNVPLEFFSDTFCLSGVAFEFDSLRIDWKKSYIDDYSSMLSAVNGSTRAIYFGLELTAI